jgi:SAM-dependent methyltransferase
MDPAYTRTYEEFELRHWWFVARREIIRQALHRYALPASPAPSHASAGQDGQGPRWLDVGCGTGVLLNACPEITDKLGLEVDAASVARAREKGLDVRQVSPGDWALEQYGRFDLVTLCDVLEHLEDEHAALASVRGVLQPGGVLLVTVPALMSLWSGHDVINRHFRRYTRGSLLRLFPSAEWDVLRVSYFSSLLLPMIWAARKWKNFRESRRAAREGGGGVAAHDFKFGPAWADRLLLSTFRLEKNWLKFSRFPLGSSVLLVVRRKP